MSKLYKGQISNKLLTFLKSLNSLGKLRMSQLQSLVSPNSFIQLKFNGVNKNSIDIRILKEYFFKVKFSMNQIVLILTK